MSASLGNVCFNLPLYSMSTSLGNVTVSPPNPELTVSTNDLPQELEVSTIMLLDQTNFEGECGIHLKLIQAAEFQPS